VPAVTGRLDRAFFDRPTELVARELLGKALVRADPAAPEGRRGGIVVEVEAYLPGDRASHAWRGRTARNAPMFGPPGHAYVYLIYGVHHCLNVVTEPAGVPAAVLIRALDPFPGTGRAGGPGLVCRALGIDRSFDGIDLTGDRLWFEDHGLTPPAAEIASGPRVGVDYAGEWAARPLRFWWRGNPHVSRLLRVTRPNGTG
jgi:DNA-3-methyladenine glycosylase